MSVEDFSKNKKEDFESALNKDDLEAYLKSGGWVATVESLGFDVLYPDIEKESPAQEAVLKAKLRSISYPDITAESQLRASELTQIKEKTDQSSHAIDRVYSWLASSGSKNLEKKELAYMAALVKIEAIEKNKEWLKKENLKIDNVKIDRQFFRNQYIYHTVLKRIPDGTPGTAWGSSMDESIKKAFDSVKENEEFAKKEQERHWKEWPEFMYLKNEYQDQLNEFGVFVSSWGQGSEKGAFSMDVISRKDFGASVRIHSSGSSWKEVFENAMSEVKKKAEKISNEENDHDFNVTSLSTKEIFDFLEKGTLSREQQLRNYDAIMQKKFENNQTVSLSNDELLKMKQRALDDENYRFAALLKSYIEKQK